MLGKLFKYEFKNTGKVMLLVCVMLIVASILGIADVRFLVTSSSQPSVLMSIVSACLLIAYFISLVASCIICYIYLMYHFFKTMFSEQGYLTHTLPVKSLTTFHVKITTAAIWMFNISALVTLSVLMLMLVGFNLGPDFAAVMEELPAILEQTFGVSFGFVVVYMIFAIVLACFAAPLMVAVCCCIGQLSNRHKITFSVVTGIAIYFIQQIVSLIASIILILNVSPEQLEAGPQGDFSALLMNFSLGYALITTAIYYVICNIIVRKHINLE